MAKQKRTTGTLVSWHPPREGVEVVEEALKLFTQTGQQIGRVLYLVRFANEPSPSLPPEVELERLRVELKNPSHHQEIYSAVQKVVLPRLQKLQGPVHINVTPGTPAMHSVWLILHASGALPEQTRLWSTQLFEAGGKKQRSLNPVEFPISTYLGAIRRDVRRTPGRAQYDPESRSLKRKAALEQLKSYATIPGAPLLLLGERGTGKTRLVEGYLRQLKNLPHVVSVPCGTLERELASSLLFGHTKGAFTDAKRDSPGYVGAAEGGVLFLDEVQDLPLEVQRKLVRFLQGPERLYRRVGEQQERSARVDVVCASHLSVGDLQKKLEPDLFDRLSLLLVELPPLRDCREDLRFDWEQVWSELRWSDSYPKEAPWNNSLDAALRGAPLRSNLRDLQRLAYQVMAYWSHDEEKSISRALEHWRELQQKMTPPLALTEWGDGSWQQRVEQFKSRLAAWAYQHHGSYKASAEALDSSEKTIRNYYEEGKKR